YNPKFIGIRRSPKQLKKRIENRAREMIKRGLVQETKKLKDSGLSWKRIYELGFEYRLPALYLQKKISKEELREKLIRESVQYARRQMLWWKRDKRIRWISPRPRL
ncbi:MAG: tRNA (adenosine(37)-N6)-dimethylallyltransferase MiaA, partial [Patescibacteria group bacterium]